MSVDREVVTGTGAVPAEAAGSAAVARREAPVAGPMSGPAVAATTRLSDH